MSHTRCICAFTPNGLHPAISSTPTTHTPVCICDGVQPVRNRQHRAVRKRAPDRRLNQCITRVVNVAGGFVEDQDAAGSQQRTRHAQQLALATAEVVAALLNGGVQASL
jgi:hypothetical protein